MATTVHISPELLRSVDSRAKALKISRNRFVVHALEQALADRSEWSPAFLDAIKSTFPGTAAVDDMLGHIKQARRSKKAPQL